MNCMLIVYPINPTFFNYNTQKRKIMQKNYKYKAFISYSHTDMKFARWLQKKIENYKIPKK